MRSDFSGRVAESFVKEVVLRLGKSALCALVPKPKVHFVRFGYAQKCLLCACAQAKSVLCALCATSREEEYPLGVFAAFNEPVSCDRILAPPRRVQVPKCRKYRFTDCKNLFQ